MALGLRAAWPLSILLIQQANLAAASDGPQVHTHGGLVTGTLLPADLGGGGDAVEQYLGVPFARAKRFAPPEDLLEPYHGGQITATMWGPACMQVGGDPFTTYGSEDCLKANIWKPQSAEAGSNLPVMVFIYGGSNQFGEAEPYNMSALAAFHEVVCVSFNYRTGPIGWMAFQEDVDARRSTGNWGILDIQSALRWVRREVRAFGGDENRVAIHGQSSGAGLVELQYVAPDSSGLFSGAISESGGLSAMSLQSALRSSADVAKSLGCLTKGGFANKSCLAAAPALGLTSATYSGSWGPAIDGVTIPASPQELLERGSINEATVVIGQQTNDTNQQLFGPYTKGGLAQPNDHADGALRDMPLSEYEGNVFASVGLQFVGEALRLYPADLKRPIMNVHQLSSLQSDRSMCSAKRRANLINRVHPGRAFLYRFDYWYQSNSECLAVPNYHLPYFGAAHQDEVTFVLGQPNFMNDGSCCGVFGLTTPDCPNLEECEACWAPDKFGRDGYRAYFNDKEFEFAKQIGKRWTDVAKNGVPPLLSKLHEHWPVPENGRDVTQNIVLNASLPHGYAVETTPYDRPEICDFWDRVAAAAKEADVGSDSDDITINI